MTNKQILEKAIRLAIDGGWSDYNSLESLELIKTTANTVTLKGWVEYVDEDGNSDESQTELTFNYKELIFNHDFAKSLWGDEVRSPFIKWKLTRKEPLKNWEYHLMQMVVSENPIKYLGEHLDD